MRDVVGVDVDEEVAVLGGELAVELRFKSAAGWVAVLTEGPGEQLSR